MSIETINILLVEDNLDHVFLARKAISQEMGEGALLFHVASAEAALDFLRRSNDYSQAPRPDFILLDLQLPGHDGLWILRSIKSDRSLQSIPVVIFTSSDARDDILKGYEAGANVYVSKPTGPDEYAARLRAIPAFWRNIAQLPPRGDDV